MLTEHESESMRAGAPREKGRRHHLGDASRRNSGACVSRAARGMGRLAGLLRQKRTS